MKKITLLFAILTMSFSFSQIIIEDFEGAAPTITPTGGLGSASITTDPVMGTNGNVLQIVSAAAGDPWQQADLLTQNDQIELTTDKTVSVDVYSSSAINVLAKVDVGGAPSATDALHGGTGWETLVFDFSAPKDNTGAANGQYEKISFYPSWAGDKSGNSPDNADWNIAVDGTTFYVDNISIESPAEPTCEDGIQNGEETGVDCGGPDCSECASATVLEGFEGAVPSITPTGGLGSASITTDPVMGTNGNVLQIVSAAAGDPWQQADLLTQNDQIELTTDKTVSVDVYSSSAINVLAKVDVGGAPSATDALHGGTGWETLVFDFSAPKDNTGAANGQYEKISFYPSWAGDKSGNSPDNADWNIAVDGTTFYVDDITAVAGSSLLGIQDYQLIEFSSYPNPTRDSWTVKTKNNKMSSIQVFNILGKNVLSLAPNASETIIDGSGLKAGIYFAQVRTAEGFSSIKLIKN